MEFKTCIIIAVSSVMMYSAMALVHNTGKEFFRETILTEDGLAIQQISVPTFLVPTVSFMELQANGTTLKSCTPTTLQFSGAIDQKDFAVGHVLTFPDDGNLNPGCRFTMDKSESQLIARDEIIFRNITNFSFQAGSVLLTTVFVSGENVVPDVEVSIMGPMLPDDLESLEKKVELEIQRNGTIPIVENVNLMWGVTVSSGTNNFAFSRTKLRVSWDQQISASASVNLQVLAAFNTTRSGNILSFPLPGSFAFRIPFLGKISSGLFGKVDYEADLAVMAQADMGIFSSVSAAQRVTIGLQAFKFERLPLSTDPNGAGLNFHTTDATQANATGFIGIRPAVQAELSLPFLGQLSVDFGGTMGISATVAYMSVPFPPFTDGRPIGVGCDGLHHVRGLLKLEGRKLGNRVMIPRKAPMEFVLLDPFIDYIVGTKCLFPASSVSNEQLLLQKFSSDALSE
ncbi:unnamed protein product [Agarophyton chilense]